MELRSGYSSLGFIKRASGQSEYKAGFDLKLCSLWVKPEAFNAFCHAVSGKTGYTFSLFQKGDYHSLSFKTDPREAYIKKRIDDCLEEKPDRLNSLLLESLALELLSVNL